MSAQIWPSSIAKRQPVERDDATEAHADVVDLEQRHAATLVAARIRAAAPGVGCRLPDRPHVTQRPLLHEHDLEGVVGLDAAARRRARPTRAAASTRCTGTSVSVGDAQVEPRSMRAAADQVDALHDEVLGQLRRCLAEAGHDRVDDGGDRLVDGLAHLLGGDRTTVLGRPLMSSRPRTSAANSSSVGERRPDGDLDLLGGALADGDAVLAADVGLDGGVDVEATRPARPRSATTPPREMSAVSEVPPPMSTTMLPIGSLMGSPAPMAAAIGCSMSWASAAPARRAASVTARRSTAVMADGTQIDHPRSVEAVDPDPLQQQADHPLGDLEVGDGTLAQRPHRDDVARACARSSATPRGPWPARRWCGC